MVTVVPYIDRDLWCTLVFFRLGDSGGCIYNNNYLTVFYPVQVNPGVTTVRNINIIYHPHCLQIPHKHSNPSLPVYVWSLILRRTCTGKQLKET